MKYLISYKNIQGVFNLLVNEKGVDTYLIPTPLDKEGIILLIDDVTQFIEKEAWDGNDVVVQTSDEETPLGIIVDVYDELGEELISISIWFEDYIDEMNENTIGIKPIKFKKDE